MRTQTIETVMTREDWEKCYKREYLKRKRERFVRKCKGIGIAAFMLLAIGCAGTSDFYTETGLVERNGIFYEVNGNQYIHTTDGNYWEVSGLNFQNGNKVRVMFDVNWTNDYTDDIIVEVSRRYI